MAFVTLLALLVPGVPLGAIELRRAAREARHRRRPESVLTRYARQAA